ncbi:uncharacterized protein PAC_02559 [Phialocephala subalpina]|uniref:Uncharacterized protein n=1 Tax=Phialocephala subalpina TaxID=576137 RepID=A0A1L7WIS6_9HELO|nr:uncharacterized protein PAC_02559 [Phialocephala subalpina]
MHQIKSGSFNHPILISTLATRSTNHPHIISRFAFKMRLQGAGKRKHTRNSKRGERKVMVQIYCERLHAELKTAAGIIKLFTTIKLEEIRQRVFDMINKNGFGVGNLKELLGSLPKRFKLRFWKSDLMLCCGDKGKQNPIKLRNDAQLLEARSSEFDKLAISTNQRQVMIELHFYEVPPGFDTTNDGSISISRRKKGFSIFSKMSDFFKCSLSIVVRLSDRPGLIGVENAIQTEIAEGRFDLRKVLEKKWPNGFELDRIEFKINWVGNRYRGIALTILRTGRDMNDLLEEMKDRG